MSNKEAKKGILEKIQVFLSKFDSKEDKKEEVILESQALKDGTLIEYDSLEAGASVFILPTEEGQEKVALPKGDYELEDGKLLVVSEDGLIGEVKEAEKKEDEEEKEEVPSEMEALSKENETLKGQVEELKALLELATLELSKEDEEKEETKKENEETKLEKEKEDEETEDITSKRNEKETLLSGKMQGKTTRERVYNILNS